MSSPEAAPAVQPAAVEDDAETRRLHRVELFATILLAVAAVATAWSTFQSTRWRGEQAIDFSKANAARIHSSEAETRARQLTQIDIATFIQWVDAEVAGKRQLAQFYRRRFRPEFRPAFAAWVATKPRTNPNAPLTPFAMPQYRVSKDLLSERLDAVARSHSDAAGEANQRSDNYVLAVVLLATSLFFAGISTKVRPLRQREALLGLGWIIFVGTAVWLAFSPVSFSL
jgi:hypothetical protein